MDSWSEQHETGESVNHTVLHKKRVHTVDSYTPQTKAKIANELSKHVIPLATHDTTLGNFIKAELHQLK